MSSAKSVAPLRLELGTSRKLIALILVSHAGALLLVWTLPWPGYSLLGLSLCILISLYLSWQWHVSQPVRELLWDAHDQWWFTDSRGRTVKADLLPQSYIHPGILVLLFKVAGGSAALRTASSTQTTFATHASTPNGRSYLQRRRAVVVFTDAADTELLRQLRVRLKTTRM